MVDNSSFDKEFAYIVDKVTKRIAISGTCL